MKTLDLALLETMSAEELAGTLQMGMPGFLDMAKTVEHSPRSTIEPSRMLSQGHGQLALEQLGARREERGIASGLEINRTLGEGGMGIVRLATQRSLGREVAVKTLKANVQSEAATLRLLREAWVTGTLEHPNIVPVYDLGLDENGSPIIVLKRIEGVEWAATMHSADVADRLEHNLKILIQLCNAVSLAHAKGVLHRDLKPENVMIGRFGEVYLVDWGIAVSLRPDPTGRLQVASQVAEVAGTPCYMAPEMLGALGGQLSERTDVYLLGGILHEILTGRPPHQGASFQQIVASALISKFELAPDVPEDLGAIMRRAMSQKPEDRFASAEELRLRLEWYLRHRGSLALSIEASRRLDEMKTLLAAPATQPGEDETLRDRLYHLAAECRFGFRQAIGACHDNEGARLGLREAIEVVVSFELEKGTAEAASAALAELENPPAELAERVNKALRARRAEKRRVERLERLDAELDQTIGRRTRTAVAVTIASVWTVAPEALGYGLRRWPDQPHWAMYAFNVPLLVGGSLMVLWGRESLSKTRVNRHMVSSAILAFAAQLALEVGAHAMGLPVEKTWMLHLVVWGSVMGGFASMADKRFWSATAGYFVAFLLASVWPKHQWHFMSASQVVLFFTFLAAWWRPAEDMPGPVMRELAKRAR